MGVFILERMALENGAGKPSTKTFPIKLTGKNYAAWEFQFRMFLKGKELWSHIDGSSSALTDAKEVTRWEAKDARIVSWILASIEPQMVNNLRSFNTAKEMWDFLKRIYLQDNTDDVFNLNWREVSLVKVISPLRSIIQAL